MVDGVLLLVDASEGPLPQTRFVLRKALELKLPVVLVVNKVDRPDARSDEVVERGLRALPRPRRERDADRVPDRLRERPRRPRRPRRPTSSPRTSGRCSRRSSPRSRRPRSTPTHPLQALVTNLDANQYVGRLALLRVHHGTLRKGEQVAWCRADGSVETAQGDRALHHRGARPRARPNEAGPGEIVALAGLPEITIGETIADPVDPRPLPVTTVDEPSLSVTIGINTSPLAGTEGDKADREQHQGAPRAGARRQRLAPRPPHLAPGPPGRCRAAASSSSRCWSS